MNEYVSGGSHSSTSDYNASPEDSSVSREHRGRHRANGSGRNVGQAIVVGAAMAAVAVAPLIWARPLFVALLAVAVAMAVWELSSALRMKQIEAPRVPLMLGGAGTIALVWFTGAEGLLIGVALTLIAALLWRIPDGPISFARDAAAAVFIACYVPLLAGFVVLLASHDDDAVWWVLAFVATTICSDTGGFVAGTLLGRRPFAPKVSPSKTWEGFAGSVVACLLCGIGFLVFALDGSWWQGALFGIAIALAATLGDLAESLIKRDLGIKDMGTILPGHGGVMDRFDSLLVAAPVAYALLSLFLES